MQKLDTTDRVVELFLELAQKLMREYGIRPEQIARVSVGCAVFMYTEHHRDGAQAGAAYLRENADALEALCAPQPPSTLN